MEDVYFLISKFIEMRQQAAYDEARSLDLHKVTYYKGIQQAYEEVITELKKNLTTYNNPEREYFCMWSDTDFECGKYVKKEGIYFFHPSNGYTYDDTVKVGLLDLLDSVTLSQGHTVTRIK